MTLRSRAEYAALLAARERQSTADFRTRYAVRAGIEGTISQGVRAFGVRQARYRGLAKTHLQQVATAAAMNVDRVVQWFDGRPRLGVRQSHVAALTSLT